MAQTTRKSTIKKDKTNFSNGIVHIQSTFNNTIVTITTGTGDTVSWASAGSSGFKGAQKSTPFAAQTAAEKAALEAISIGMKSVNVLVKEHPLRILSLFLCDTTSSSPTIHHLFCSSQAKKG